ncbi:MAG: hypothetical protein K6E63_02390 [Lachnospiraceae bacterium]|nr:hypothetical protein [Lachnospiraceae bacterium]
MIIICLDWLYIFATCYITGHAILSRVKNEPGYSYPCLFELMTGFAFVTAYSGYFSVFHKVGLAANILLVILCIICFIIDKDHYLTLPGKIKKGFKARVHIPFLIISFIAFFVIVFMTCYGMFHSDSGLYHAQSIRWIEEYGVIKGLALVQNRFGYNSAFFSVSALYGFSFLGQSLHGVNGFMALIVTLHALHRIILAVNDKKLNGLAPIVSLAPLIYTVIGGIELISPTTDPVLLYLVFGIMICWCELIDGRITQPEPYAVLCVLTVFLVSVKLSVGVLVLLTIYPAVKLVKEKKFGTVFGCVMTGFLSVLPYFIRNVIISGWLIYPFTAIDLFNVPWKLPLESTRHDADEITTWARYVRDASKIDQSVFEWAPVWWSGQTNIDRFFSGAAIVSLIIGIVWCISALIRLMKNRSGNKEGILGQLVFAEAVMIMGFLFWFSSAPLIRYGYLYLLMMPLLTAAVIINDTGAGRIIKCAVAALFACMLIYPVGFLLKEDIQYMHHNWSRAYAIRQKDYPEAPVKERDFCGVTFYYPEEPGTPVWYDAFPSVLYEDNFSFMEPFDGTLKGGFKISGQ